MDRHSSPFHRDVSPTDRDPSPIRPDMTPMYRYPSPFHRDERAMGRDVRVMDRHSSPFRPRVSRLRRSPSPTGPDVSTPTSLTAPCPLLCLSPLSPQSRRVAHREPRSEGAASRVGGYGVSGVRARGGSAWLSRCRGSCRLTPSPHRPSPCPQRLSRAPSTPPAPRRGAPRATRPRYRSGQTASGAPRTPLPALRSRPAVLCRSW
jgi:hypothetical protein